MAKLNISWPDILVIVLYLGGIVGLGLWAWSRRKRTVTSTSAYFLAGGTLRWSVIGLALFSTNISTIHLVSLAQEGYVNGLAYGNFEWMAAFLLIALSFFFAPFYIRSRVATLPDFLERRYSRACGDWLAVLSILSAVFIHIGFSLYTGAVVLKGMFGIDINLSIFVTAALTGVYTIVGGLLATFIGMITALLWSPLISHFQSIFQGIVALICYIAPPITAVFVWGVFWRRASAAGALATLSIGSGLGLTVFFLDWFKDRTGWSIPSMMATFYLFVICSVILVVLSYLKPHQHTGESERLVWSSPLAALRGRSETGGLDYRTLALVLFIVMIALYIIFA